MKSILLIATAALLSACTSASTGTTTASSAGGAIRNSCINPTEIRKQTVVSDQEIQFELRNGEVWKNTLPRVCPGLNSRQAFSWDVRGTLVCSNQQSIKVQEEGTTCLLGEFAKLPAAAG
jgi:hypothetical protein